LRSIQIAERRLELVVSFEFFVSDRSSCLFCIHPLYFRRTVYGCQHGVPEITASSSSVLGAGGEMPNAEFTESTEDTECKETAETILGIYGAGH